MKIKVYKKLVGEVLSHIDEGIHVIDEEGRTVIYNDAMAKLEKMRPRDVLNKQFLKVFRNLDPSESTMMAALREGKTTREKHQVYKNKHGKEVRTINTTMPVWMDDEIAGAIELAKDVTKIQEMSETILDLQNSGLEGGKAGPRMIRRYSFDDIIGENREFLQVIRKARKAAETNHAVLIYGETGTGKELFAQSIHYLSDRREKPFLAQNCAALPESLLEGILFGTAKGGFTGAVDRAGLFEQASGGTLLLDEISAMPYELQGKLLRVLQENYVRPVGGLRDVPVDVRIIATINEPAEELLRSGRLRKDLYYRINIISLKLLPLRERRDDILLLAKKFLDKHNREMDREVWMLREDAQARLLEHDYPGNVRELENVIISALSMTEGEHVLSGELIRFDTESRSAADVGAFGRSGKTLDCYLTDLEEQIVCEEMERCGGNISAVARKLGVSRQNLQHKLKKYKEQDWKNKK